MAIVVHSAVINALLRPRSSLAPPSEDPTALPTTRGQAILLISDILSLADEDRLFSCSRGIGKADYQFGASGENVVLGLDTPPEHRLAVRIRAPSLAPDAKACEVETPLVERLNCQLGGAVGRCWTYQLRAVDGGPRSLVPSAAAMPSRNGTAMARAQSASNRTVA